MTHDGESLNVDGSEFVVDDQFEHQLAPCPKLVLSGQRDEDAGSHRIARVLVEQLRDGMEGTGQLKYARPNGRWLDVKANQKIEFSMDTDSHSYAIWVEPEGTNRLGVRFEVAKGAIEKLLERTVSFPVGAQLKGQLLNEQTAEPIEGGTICWFDSDQRCVASDGTFPLLNVGADKQGNFEIAVPREDGVIGVVGGIKGFQSLKNFSLMKFAKESVRTRFMQSISEASLADGLSVEFRLEPSLTAKIKVLRPDGLPAGQAVVSGNAVQIRPTGPSRLAAFPETITLEADDDGNVLLSDWYSSAIHVASARGELASEKEIGIGFSQGKQHPFVDARLAKYPTRFESFSSDGLWQGNVTVPLPVPLESTNAGQKPEILILQLRNGSTILGEVVDERGKGMADLKVSAVSHETVFHTTSNGRQVWTTRTRDDGKFRIVGVTPLRDYEITLGNRNVKLLTGVVSLDGKSSLLPNAVFKLPRVECVDMRMLDESFPEISIAGMKQAEAVEVVRRYLERQLQRIPEIPIRFKDTTGRSGGDPVPAFLDRLVEKVLPICKKTAALAPGSKAELQLLNYLQLITNLEPHAYPGAGVKQTRDFMLDRILRHYNEDPVVQPLLLRIAQRGDKWQRLMEDAKSQETQQFAGEQFVGRKLDQLIANTARNDPFDRFGRDWAQLKPMLKPLGGIIKNNKRTDRIDRFRSRVEEWRKWAHKTMKGLPKAEAASAALKVDRLFKELDAWVEEHSNR